MALQDAVIDEEREGTEWENRMKLSKKDNEVKVTQSTKVTKMERRQA